MTMSSIPFEQSVSPERLSVVDAATVIKVAGEVDLATTDDFRRALAVCDRDPVVRALDLSGVSFFSAAGVRCFVEADWPRRPHVDIIAAPPVRRVLDLCGLGFLLASQPWSQPFDG